MRIGKPTPTGGHGGQPTSAAPITGTPSLSARYSYALDDSGYRGSVQVVNSGTGAAVDWTVALTVPGGEAVSVTSGSVSMSQAGSSVTFRPSAGSVRAGGSVSFGFTLDTVPAIVPGGCAIDGVACS
ncbi:cellulose binding domain-containing protein [Actinoplanes ianthinogenes]|uniref:cellulose binding domain-containing protein n=1 Tax=Actinoplanes ianthinogenes TaxID=122358 RepID=UPI003CC83274